MDDKKQKFKLLVLSFSAVFAILLAWPNGILALDIVKFPPASTIGPYDNEGAAACEDRSRVHVCPAGQVVCGMRTTSQGGQYKTYAYPNIFLCCDLSDDAKKAGVTLIGPQYPIDGDNACWDMYCYQPYSTSDLCHETYLAEPMHAVIGGKKWAGQWQLDEGMCQELDKVKFSGKRLVSIPGSAFSTDFKCNADEVVCGGKNDCRPDGGKDKNDQWGNFYCCKVLSSKLTVHAFIDPDNVTDVNVDFTLVGSADITNKTYYENNIADSGSYTLSVPQSVLDDQRFKAYACIMYTSADPTEVSCAGNTLTGTLGTAMQLDFFIKFKNSCIPKTCASVTTGGAQCGKFNGGCGECDISDSSKQGGCIDCGACANTAAICTSDGKCVSPLDASCNMTPALITAGQSSDFTIHVANGIEPYTCVWHSDSAIIDGKTSCAFNAAFPQAGSYGTSVDITDSSNPPNKMTATCVLTAEPVAVPTSQPPEAETLDWSLCEVYKVVIYYGMPLFAIVSLIGGLLLLMSFGNVRRVQTGKSALTAGIAGLAVLLLAKPIFLAIIAFLGFQVYLCGQMIP
jgi:hypothetical protein